MMNPNASPSSYGVVHEWIKRSIKIISKINKHYSMALCFYVSVNKTL